MKVVCSIKINEEMFDKLVEIGFIQKTDGYEQGLINGELVVHRKDGDTDYYRDNYENRLLNVGITNIDIDVWDKLVAIGAITSPQYTFYEFESPRYFLSGCFLDVIAVTSQSYDDPRPEFCINCSHGISDIKNHPCQWLERDEQSCNKQTPYEA